MRLLALTSLVVLAVGGGGCPEDAKPSDDTSVDTDTGTPDTDLVDDTDEVEDVDTAAPDEVDSADVDVEDTGPDSADTVDTVDPDAPDLTEPGTFTVGEANLPQEYVFKSVWAGETGRVVAVGNDGIVATQELDGSWRVLARAEGADLLNAAHGFDGQNLWAVGRAGAILRGTVDSFGESGACQVDGDCQDGDSCTVDRCVDNVCVAESTQSSGCCGWTPGSWNFDTNTLQSWVNQAAQQIGPWGWQVVSRPNRSTSGSYALWFGNPNLGTYGGGVPLAATIQSPNIRLPPTGTATLKFNVYLDAEPDTSFDILEISVQSGVERTEVWHKRNLSKVPTNGFVPVEVNLTPWRGKVIQLRVRFDSIDETVNDFEGPYIDDLRVETACVAGGTGSLLNGPTLWGVYGLSKNLAFAVGRGGAILQFDGSTWAPSKGADESAVWNGMSGFGTTLSLVGNNGQAIVARGAGIETVNTGTSNNLQSVFTPDGIQFFAVGDLGTLLQGTGVAWTLADLGLAVSMRAVHGVRADDVYAVGYQGTIVHWNGSAWRLLTSPTSANLLGVWVDTAGKVTIVGQDGKIFEGDKDLGFTEVAMLNQGGELTKVWGMPDGSFMVAAGTQGKLVQRVAGVWSTMTSITSQALSGVWGTSPTDVWAVGRSGLALRWDGTLWKRVVTPVTSPLTTVWGDAANRYYAAGSAGALLTWNGEAWASVASGTTENLRAVFGRNGTDVWTVGANGTILHYNGLGWGKVKVEGIPNADGGTDPIKDELLAVWMASDKDGWAVGDNGRILRWDGLQWNIVETDWKTALRGIYGLAANDVWAVGTTGHVLHWNGEAWEKVPTTSIATLYAIHGDGKQQVVVVGDLGTVLRLSR